MALPGSIRPKETHGGKDQIETAIHTMFLIASRSDNLTWQVGPYTLTK